MCPHEPSLETMTLSDSTGVEQPIYNSRDGYVYLSVESTTANSGGEIKVIDASTQTVVRVIAEQSCSSRGGVFGKDGVTLTLACGSTTHLHALQINVNTGKQTEISDLGQGDEVAYNSNTDTYFITGYRVTSLSAVLGVVQGSGSSANLVDTVDTSDIFSHSVAVDETTGYIFVPLRDGLGVISSGSQLQVVVGSLLMLLILAL